MILVASSERSLCCRGMCWRQSRNDSRGKCSFQVSILNEAKGAVESREESGEPVCVLIVQYRLVGFVEQKTRLVTWMGRLA